MKSILPFAAFCGLSLLVAQAVVADTSKTTQPSPSGVVKTSAGQGVAYFDWMQKGTPAGMRVLASDTTRAPGNGNWVCSPAGFGKKSTCRRR
nr:hypothetical protein [uncultured Celeribacter sp.]